MSPLIILALSICIFSLRFFQWYLFLGRKLGRKYFAYVDTWWFLNEARKLRKGNFALSSKHREERPEWENDYPPLFQYLLAIVPDKYIKDILRYAVPLLDAFTASTLFSVLAVTMNSWEYGILGTIVFFSSPMIFQQNFCLCVRPLTILIVSMIYLLSCNFSILSFVALSLLISIILLLHKFAAQVTIFTSLAFLIIGQFIYMLAVATGFLIAVLISRGYYLKVLKAHVNRLKSSDLKRFADSRAKNPLKRTAMLVIYCPWLILFVISAYLLGGNVFVFSPFPICNFTWILTIMVLSVATNFWIFRVIGEGWRYLGYLVFPMSFHVVAVFDYALIIQWIYLVTTLFGLVIGYYYSNRLFKGHRDYLVSQEDIDVFRKISSINGKTITAYPSEFTYVSAYFSEKDYAIRPELANIVVVNTQLTEKELYKKLEEKGYSEEFRENKWAIYSRIW